MTLPDIALIGRARCGKDTIADYLVREHGYVRVAFADALKEMALSVDPIAISDEDDWGVPGERLSEVVGYWGWEVAKDRCPEVRRFLQNLGVAVREQKPDFWLRAGLEKFVSVRGRPVVFTDVRFRNEAEALENWGFLTVSVTRPCRITEGLDAVDTHVSETELVNYPTDRAICNAGTIADLESDVRKYLLGM